MSVAPLHLCAHRLQVLLKSINKPVGSCSCATEVLITS